MLRVTGLCKSYATRAGALDVLRGIDLALAGGASAAIMGPSGCGKSTLLHILGTLDRPSAGSVALDEVDPFALDDAKLAQFRNTRIGFVFQDHHLLPQLSAFENVLLPTFADAAPHPQAEPRARELLDRVGLAARLEHPPAELSGGERQRAAVARALINRPALLLADEPTGNLDRGSADAVAALLAELCRAEKFALLVVTHSRRVADRFDARYELTDGLLSPAPAEHLAR